jgi:hypothetical protein
MNSILGAVMCADQEEGWPTYEGVPMVGVAQFNLTELPFRPVEMSGVAMLSVYGVVDRSGLVHPNQRFGGDGWLIRTYERLDGLTQVVGPTLAAGQSLGIAWDLAEDLPAWEDVVGMVAPGVLEDLAGNSYEDLIGRPAGGTKIGGWPTLLQSEIFWAPFQKVRATFVFQLDGDQFLSIGLGEGVIHVGWSADDANHWIAETQLP